MNKTGVLAAIGALLVASALGAAIILGGDGQPRKTGQSTAVSTQQASPTPPAASSPAPQPSAAPLPGRTSCAEIRGTPYRSDTERAFYLANCTGSQAAVASTGSIATDTSASCSSNIQINSQSQ